MRATATTAPEALAAGVARYADGRSHDDFFWGDAKAPSGEVVWTWTVRRDVPEGDAVLLVTASHSQKGGGAVEAAFEVRRPGACRE